MPQPTKRKPSLPKTETKEKKIAAIVLAAFTMPVSDGVHGSLVSFKPKTIIYDEQIINDFLMCNKPVEIVEVV